MQGPTSAAFACPPHICSDAVAVQLRRKAAWDGNDHRSCISPRKGTKQYADNVETQPSSACLPPHSCSAVQQQCADDADALNPNIRHNDLNFNIKSELGGRSDSRCSHNYNISLISCLELGMVSINKLLHLLICES